MAVFQDMSGRAAGPAALRVRGLVVAIVLAICGVATQMYFTGQFGNDFNVVLEASTIGEGLAPGADVKFRGLRIGQVQSIEARGYGQQFLTLALERRQTDPLTSDMTAKYQTSNIFGAPSIELMAGVGKTPLREGATLKIDSSGKVASVTSVLRQLASLTTLLGTDKVQHLLRLAVRNGDLLGPGVKIVASLGRIYADNLRKPVVEFINEITPLVNGISVAIGPGIKAIETFYDYTEFLANSEGHDATIEAVENQKIVVFDEIGSILDHIKSPAVDSLGVILDVGHPLFMSAGSAASAWGNLENFLNRAEDAMPTIDGKVKLRLEVLLPASRALPQAADENEAQQAQSQNQQVQAPPADPFAPIPSKQQNGVPK